MKILYCCHADNYHIEKWIPALQRVGVEIHVLTLRPSKKIIAPQTIIEPLFGRIQWLDFFFLAPKIRETFFEVKADVLLCSFASTYGLAGFLSGIKPFFVQTWSRDIGAEVSVTKRESLMSRFISRFICAKADGITTDGPHFKRFVHQYWPEITQQNVLSTWWGIDVDFWKHHLEKKQHHKKKWGIPIDSTVLISPRGVFWYYRPKDVLTALLDVLAQKPSLFVLLPTLNHDRTQETQNIIHQLSQHPRVRVADSFLEPEIFREWIQMSDFLLSVPLFDGISEVIQEGMLCGTIPILNPIEANSVLFDEGGMGFMSPSKQPKRKEIFDLILHALSTNFEELSEMKLSNHEFIQEKCSVQKTAESLKSFLESKE